MAGQASFCHVAKVQHIDDAVRFIRFQCVQDFSAETELRRRGDAEVTVTDKDEQGTLL